MKDIAKLKWFRKFNPASPAGKLLVTAACLLAVTFLAYRFFVGHVRQINYRIFDTEDNFSWVEMEKGVFRKAAYGFRDNLLLSADTWREFTLSFQLHNPRDCGVVFNYRGPQSYHFVYFHQPTNAIFWAEIDGAEKKFIQRIPLPQQPVLPCQLKVNGITAQLSIAGVPLAQIETPELNGKFGILINDADDPRMVFQDVTVSGTLANGRAVTGRSPPEFRSPGFRYVFALVPFYALLIIFSIFLATGVFPYFKGRSGAISPAPHEVLPINTLTAAWVHLLLAAAVFSPFLLRGEILVSSYDNIGEIFPLFFLSKHKFIQMIQSGTWSLWNPYFHDGTPFYSNHWNMIYYPFNWPIFMLPDKYVMSALTCKTFVEVFLCGFLAYGFFNREIPSKFWALFSSITYQLGSFLIFALSIFPTITLYFSMTLYLYLLWSAQKRRLVWNYALLTAAVYLLVTSANVVFIFYAVLALAVITVYRLYSLKQDRLKAAGLALAAACSGLLISAVRWWPCLAAIMDSNRIVDNYATIHDRAMLAIRLFMPEIAGWFGTDSFNALMSPNLRLIFQQMNMPSNPQNAFFIYFGLLPALLLVVSLLIKTKGAYSFWKIYAGVTLAIGLLLQPFWGILSILLFPLMHFSYHSVIIPVGLSALAGHAGCYIEQNRLRLKETGRKLILVLLLIQMYIFVFITYLFPQATPWTRFALIIIIAGYAGHVVLRRFSRLMARRYVAGLVAAFNILAWVLFFYVSTLILLKPFPRKEGLAEYVIIPLLAFMAVAAAAIYLYAYRKRHGQNLWGKPAFWFLTAAVPLAAGIVWGTSGFTKIMSLPEGYRIYVVDLLLAQTRIFFIVQLGILAFIILKARWFSKAHARILLMVILSADLLMFNLRFDSITAPFSHKKAFYDKSFSYYDLDADTRARLDLVNYRVHAQHLAELNANKNVIFDLPSYTGTVGYLTRSFSDYISNFGYPEGAILIYPDDAAFFGERFLDLSAVRYAFKGVREYIERPSTLARLNIFYRYEVIPDRKALLARLKDEAFDPHKTVLLDYGLDPGFVASESGTAETVPILNANSDRITAQVTAQEPAVLLFNESYDTGWRAFIDGQAVPLVRANYNFMACALPAGTHAILFEYRPKRFYQALYLSLAALAVFILIVLVSAILKIRAVKVKSY